MYRVRKQMISSQVNDSTTIFRHYLFDIEMFTRISIPTSVSFTTGEKVTGGFK